ncbi:MAG: helix-hairpin-helix domain-containing protein [Candidatus Aenigmarchaeota archaeon]|nr:helix-hairpin-helix domain-containing protein [Candidatus Aenigmarchaeota archaeon]
MELQKILKPKDKILIVCDYREKDVIEELKKLGALVNVQSLKVGDFIVSEKVCIEKKTHSDFISSIIDGRIFEQASSLRKNFEKPIILIEGYSNREISDNALKAALACLLIDFGISLVSTKNPLDTAKLVYWIAKKEQSEAKNEVAIKIGKKPKDMKKIQEFIVCSLPGVSTKTAVKLLKEFGSVEKVFSASEEELKKVLGKKAEKIKKILSEKY